MQQLTCHVKDVGLVATIVIECILDLDRLQESAGITINISIPETDVLGFAEVGEDVSRQEVLDVIFLAKLYRLFIKVFVKEVRVMCFESGSSHCLLSSGLQVRASR
ncbi:hypothetical protein D3C78_1571930 [compost metagenome]